MLLVQEYLKTKSLKRLEREHGVKSKISGHKVSLNYSITETKNSDLLSQQCRGLVLRLAEPEKHKKFPTSRPVGETVVLARPFDRFFNYGQEAAADVDFSKLSTTFYEKVDGTLCLIYYDDFLQEWHVATRGIPEADVPLSDTSEYTFRTLFEKAVLNTVGKEFDVWTSNMLFRDTTYMFELTSPYNKIVIEYDSPSITLLGARRNLSGKEISPAFVQAQVKVPAAARYQFKSVEDLMTFVSSRSPSKHEGVVVCDSKFRRVKVKNIGYLAFSKLCSFNNSEDTRNIASLVLLGEIDDVLPLLTQEVSQEAVDFREKYLSLLIEHKNVFRQCLKQASKDGNKKPSPEHRKAFAISARALDGWLAPLMEQYQGNVKTLPEWIKAKREKNGKWSNGFLDNVIKEVKKESNV